MQFCIVCRREFMEGKRSIEKVNGPVNPKYTTCREHLLPIQMQDLEHEEWERKVYRNG